MELGIVKVGATTAKKMKTAMAPTTAPISGRPRSVEIRERRATRSSVIAMGAARVVLAMKVSLEPRTGRIAPPGPEMSRLADALLCALEHRGGVIGRDDRGSGGNCPAATESEVPTVLQPERVHRLVALEVGLLIDGEDDLLVDDGLSEVGVHVERADLRARTRLL